MYEMVKRCYKAEVLIEFWLYNIPYYMKGKRGMEVLLDLQYQINFNLCLA